MTKTNIILIAALAVSVSINGILLVANPLSFAPAKDTVTTAAPPKYVYLDSETKTPPPLETQNPTTPLQPTPEPDGPTAAPETPPLSAVTPAAPNITEAASIPSAAASSAPETTVDPSSSAEPGSGIQLVSVTSPIYAGDYAAIKIKGEPGTRYSITVYYTSGPSKASGLEAKTSDGEGYASWTWRVGTRTKAGTFTIEISGGGQDLTVPFTVK